MERRARGRQRRPPLFLTAKLKPSNFGFVKTFAGHKQPEKRGKLEDEGFMYFIFLFGSGCDAQSCPLLFFQFNVTAPAPSLRHRGCTKTGGVGYGRDGGISYSQISEQLQMLGA